MIRIACTNCKTVLSIDDAFAGGVCRCQHCGTIQTVPAHAKGRAEAAQPVSGSKAIYHRGGKSSDASDSSLDELAGAVASSGLSGSGLTSRRLTRPTPAGGAKSNSTLIFAVVGGVILILVIVIIWLVTHGTPSTGTGSTANTTGRQETSPNAPVSPTPAATLSGPNFCGIKLDAPSVIYVLDRGTATKEVFAALKEAALKSATSLGSQRKFEIVFWNNGSDAAYPENSTTFATKENVDAAGRAIEEVFAFGASDAKPAMQKALSHDPNVIVIATAKGYDLDDAWVQEMLDARGSSSAKITTVDLGTGAPSPALKTLANKTGGEYRQVNGTQLSSFGGQ